MNKVQAIIKVINPVREGISKTSGKEWKSQDVVIGWVRPTATGYEREQLMAVTLHGESIDRLKALNPVPGQTVVECDLDFQTRMYGGRVYNEITMYV